MTTKRQIIERLDKQAELAAENACEIRELRSVLGSLPYKDFSSWLRDISARVDALAEHLGVEFDSRSHVCVTPKSKE
jgi:hypothetical protein